MAYVCNETTVKTIDIWVVPFTESDRKNKPCLGRSSVEKAHHSEILWPKSDTLIAECVRIFTPFSNSK